MRIPTKSRFMIFCLSFAASSCGSHIKIKCPPDDRTVLVLKDINKVYPTYAKEYDIAVKQIEKAIEDTLLSSTISVGFRNKVVKFREDLKQDAINLENSLKAALVNRQTDPCDKEAGRRFDELLKVISTKRAELEGKSLKSLSQQAQDSGNGGPDLGASRESINQHIENSPGSIQVAGDLNIIPDRTKYHPLLPSLRESVTAALAAVRKKYEGNCPAINIFVENGNRNRSKIVQDIIDILKSASFERLQHSSGMSFWRGVPPPVEIKLHPDDVPFLKDFARAIAPFLQPSSPATADTSNVAGTIKISFIGEPKFNSNGSVRFE